MILTIFNNPRGCQFEQQEIAYRLELCNLQADSLLLNKNVQGVKFFELLSDKKYPKLIDLGLKIYSIFGSTYKCESTSATKKYRKSQYRSALTDESLLHLLRIATSNMSIRIPSLVAKMTRPQCSH